MTNVFPDDVKINEIAPQSALNSWPLYPLSTAAERCAPRTPQNCVCVNAAASHPKSSRCDGRARLLARAHFPNAAKGFKLRPTSHLWSVKEER